VEGLEGILEIAQAIYQQIPAYCFLMESLLKKLEGFSD
jgi:hypothetical protein